MEAIITGRAVNGGLQPKQKVASMSGLRFSQWNPIRSAHQLPRSFTWKGRHDRAVLALLAGCVPRRGEAVSLTLERFQQRDGRWVIVDLRGKHGRVRTIPVPAWVKLAVDLGLEAMAITEGRLLRSLNCHGQITGSSLSPQGRARFGQVLWQGTGMEDTASTRSVLCRGDLRRTCAKPCRSAGGELEQIQLLLSHSSIQTTERYPGSRQDLVNFPNDRIGLRGRDQE
jgi:integrase